MSVIPLPPHGSPLLNTLLKMDKNMISYRYASKQNYPTQEPVGPQELQAGALMRIADALERREAIESHLIERLKSLTHHQERYYNEMLRKKHQKEWRNKNLVSRKIKIFGWTLTISKPKL